MFDWDKVFDTVKKIGEAVENEVEKKCKDILRRASDEKLLEYYQNPPEEMSGDAYCLLEQELRRRRLI